MVGYSRPESLPASAQKVESFLFLTMLRPQRISIFLLFATLFTAMPGFAQGPEATSISEIATRHEEKESNKRMLEKIYSAVLTRGQCYEWLRGLCKDIGPRLSGSEGAAKAVTYTADLMRGMKLDSVWLQPVMVPHWERGKPETGRIYSKAGKVTVPVCALGGSVGTSKKGIRGKVIEVQGIQQVEKMSREEVEGKIVFYNRPMNPALLNTFHAYGDCVDQRSKGASAAAKKGAIGVIVRSMNLSMDDYPHTGNMRYAEGVPHIPAAAISTNGARMLNEMLRQDAELEFLLKMDCQTFPDAPSHNVIGEIRGTEYPEEVIVIGGHLDSWDLGEGAHDDGAGCMQALEVVRTFMDLGIRPKRTIRAIMYINEENGIAGAKVYGAYAATSDEKHIAGLESDRGGFTPRGFTVEGGEATLNYLSQWAELFRPYGLYEFANGYGGVDISTLRDLGTILIGFDPDSQRYFDYHHAASDVFEAVNKRELELGAAAMTGLVWLISENGIPTLK